MLERDIKIFVHRDVFREKCITSLSTYLMLNTPRNHSTIETDNLGNLKVIPPTPAIENSLENFQYVVAQKALEGYLYGSLASFKAITK